MEQNKNTLSENDRKKLDDIVLKMMSEKKSNQEIQATVDNFKNQYGLKKKEPTQSDSGNGKSVLPSKEEKLPTVETPNEKPINQQTVETPSETIEKPVSILDRYKVGEGLDRDRKFAEQDVLSRKPIPPKVEKTTIVSKDPILGLPVYEEKTKVITDDRERPQQLPKIEKYAGTGVNEVESQLEKEAKTKYLWDSVQKDIDESYSITSKEHFRRLSGAFANAYLDEAQLQEYSFVQNLRDADERVKSAQSVLEKHPSNPAAQLSLSKAIADKAQQEAQYTKFKEDKYKQIDAEIKDLEEKINLNPITSTYWDAFRRDDYINRIKDLKAQKENFFLDENALIQKKYSENKSTLDKFQIPGDTPRERLQNYYLTLNKERDLKLQRLKNTYGEDVFKSTSGATMASLASFIGTDATLDKFFAIEEKMKSLAPAVLINRNPVKDVNQGFFETTLKNAVQTIAPASQYVISNPSELASYVKESLALSSLPNDVLSKATGKIVSEKAKGPESYNKEWWGNFIGTSVGMIPYFAAGTSLVKSASVAMDFAKISNYLAGAKFGKYLVSYPVMTGLGYKTAGYLMPANSLVKDEATFLSGFFGGLGVVGVNKLINTRYVTQMFNKLFGDKAESMALMIAKSGERVANGVGETFEEAGNNIGPMIDAWIATGDFQKLKSDFNENFGSMDKNLELFVASFTMGAIMGHGNVYGKTVDARSKDYYNNLSAEDKKKADSFVERLTQERYNAMVAAKKAEIKETGIKPKPVTEKDLTDKQEAINVLTNPQAAPDQKKAALSVLADVNLKIENDKLTKAAEAELKAGNTSTEVKPEDAVMEPIPSAEGTITTSEGTVKPTFTETKVEPAVYEEFVNTGNVPDAVLKDIATKVQDRTKLTEEEQAIFAGKTADINKIISTDFAQKTEAKPLAEGDQVQLEPQMKGGMPRIMEFKDNTWQQKVGNEYTAVSKEVQQEAQNLYDSQNKQRVSGEVGVGQEPIQTKPIEGGRQEAPSPSGNVQAPQEVGPEVAGTVELKSMEMANKNVSKFLQDSDIDVNILDTQEAFDQALKDEGQAAERGTEGAFVGKSGKIFINKSALGKGWAKTILYHEATHPVINIIRNTNIDKYNSLVNGVKELAKTNQDVQEALDWAKDQYKGSPEGTIEDEGIVEVIARVSDGKIKFGQIEPTLREKIVDFINQIAKAIGLPPITSKTDTETFKKTARQVANAMRKGKSISKVVGKENVSKYQYEAISGLGSQFSITKFGKSGVKKSPVLDKDEYKKKLQNGTLKISSPQEALGDSTFMLTFPDDLFVGDIFIGNNKVAEFGGGVVYAIVEGEKGRMWASVSEKTAKAFADNVNKSLKINNGTSYVVLVKGADTKHVSSMSAKVGFMKTLLRYAEKNESMANGLLTAIKEIYSIGNVAKPELAIKRFDNYLEGGRGEDGQTMKEAKSAYDGLRSALIKYANPLITKMALEMGYGNEYFNGTKLKGKNPIYEASNLTVDKMFADLLQEDFLKGVPAGEAYAVIKTNSEVTIKNDLSHPSYPWVILTKDGSPVTLELFDKTFMTYGKNEAITGRYNEPTEGPTGGFGQVSYTIPKFKLNPDKKLQGPGTTDLLGALSKYKAISESESQAQKSMGGRQGLETSEKEITFAQDETRKQKGVTPRGQRVDRQVGSDSSQMGTESSRTRGFQRVDSTESRRLGGRTVRVSAIYKPTSSLIDGIKSAIPKATVDSEILEITSSPEEFHRLISNAKAINEHGASVFVYEDETTRQHQYDGMRLFITPDGKAGLALKPNGDLVSGFNTKDKTKPNRLPQLILLAIKEGATKTDAFNTVLPDYYSKFGFRAVAKSTFNDEFAPKEYKDIYGNKQVGWDYDTYKKFQEGRPDVVYFVYDGGDRATIQDRVGTFEPYSDYENIVPLVSDPDEGAAMQDKAMGKAQASKGGRETVVVDGAQQRVASVPDSLSIVDGFYSPIEKRITEFKQPKASATKWKEIVGSKSDEAVFSGMADWLNTFKPDQQISKEEVQNFIKNNRVEIKQVIKADNWREFYNERMAEIEKETEYFRQKGFDAYTISRTPDEMFDKLNDADQDRLINLKAEKDFLNDVYFDYGNSRQVFTGAKEEDMPKYIKYINRGDAQNYKEILVVAPISDKIQKANAAIEKRLDEIEDEIEQTREYKKVGDTGTVNDFKLVVNDQERYDSLVAERKYLITQEKANTEKILNLKGDAYKSSHYNEKNIVVHTRTDVRRDSDDNKVFFIEEVQSDWGQEGKKEGFISENKRDAQRQYEIDKNRYQNIQKNIKQEKFNLDINREQEADIETIKKSGIVAWLGLKEFNGKTVFTKDSKEVTPPKKEDIIPSEDLPRNYVDAYNRVKERSKKLDEYMAEKDRLIAKYGLTYNPYGVTSLTAPEGIYEGQITEGPYVTNTNSWTKLGLKIALQQAVKEGADKIAWTTGEQQNKRYDLSKQVDAVTYEKNDDGTYNVDGIKNNRSVSYKEDVQADQLESMLGKDVAERIINDEGDTYFDGKYMGGVKVLTGDQLTVGGKGMTAFYGNMETPGILGNVAKALVKELTGVEPKIEGTALGYSLDQEDEVIKTLDEYDNSLKKGGIFYHYGEVLTKSQALEYIERGLKIGVSYPKADIQPSIVITPELRAAVEKGMPQFSRGERGVAAETEKVFDKATDLFYKIKGTEGSAKRKALADERKALMDKNPSIKFIDDNIKKVLDQLESKEVATRKGNCP